MTAKATAMVCWLFVGSWTFASIFSYLGGHRVIEVWVVGMDLQVSFLTPPMAMSAYYLKEVLKKQIELMEIFRGIIPYLGTVIFCMFLMYQFPGITLWQPDYLFGKWIP
ncbi:TRAP transporter large permease subunit [Parasedimentitalea psychrophila]|uniref:TRAP transporter large permease subunit n=1 Tax=Parasedimentitalea psychrophila TaxID=2997337 RepID=A0A9Y2P354_9RHOB|nr:TRAP transporter large permease subunit [Parasedimentitalea psychrophila]WIY25712.1 TRAP transporter large permease subunit [Parasedimentitalea psychrophila]